MALTASSQASRLFKKSFGYGETSTINEWFEELNYRGPEIVLSNQIWSESGLIPSTTPWPSGTVSGASAGVIQYFDKVSMIAVSNINAVGKSFYLEDLKNSLGYSVADGSYGPKIFTSTNVAIPFGAGNWLVDHSAGLLTFYPGDSGGGLMPAGVNALNPPKISFYKYIGAIGVSASGGGSGTVYAGVGLTATGATLSVDFQSITGTGLTQNGGQISIDNTSLSNLLAGNGLSASGGTLSVNVGNGLSIDSDTIVLGGTQTSNVVITSNSFDFTIQDFNQITLTGSIIDVLLDNGDFLLDTGTQGNVGISTGVVSVTSETYVDLDTPELIVSADIVDITSTTFSIIAQNLGITIDQSSISSNSGLGLVYANDYYSTFVTHSLVDKNYVDVQLSNLELDIILGLTAGAGLTGGGTSSDVTLSIELANLSGLTFSTVGDDGALQVSVDGSSISINTSGQLYVVAGASQPFYQSAVSSVTTGDNSSTGISLTHTPNDYSRIQVFVNGQLQKLGDGSKTLDCYFSDDSGSTAKSLVNLSASDTLYWNGLITKYDLDAQDEVTIIYEY